MADLERNDISRTQSDYSLLRCRLSVWAGARSTILGLLLSRPCSRFASIGFFSLPASGQAQTAVPWEGQTGANTEVVEQEIMTLQYALHNWLTGWLAGPTRTVPRVSSTADEPSFVHNALQTDTYMP